MEIEEEAKPGNPGKEEEGGDVDLMSKDEEIKSTEEDGNVEETATEEDRGKCDATSTQEASSEEKHEDGRTKEKRIEKSKADRRKAETDQEKGIEDEDERGEVLEGSGQKEEKTGSEDDPQRQQSPASTPSIQQPAKALTAYFLFMMENRSKVNVEEGSTLQRTLSKTWQSLDAEKKKVYVERAEKDKKRFLREREEFIAAGGKKDAKPPDLILSAHRVKKVLALDDEIKKGLAKETISLVSKATEHFLERFTERVARIARNEGRKTIKSNDFFSALNKYREFEFLKVPMPAPGDYRPHFKTTTTSNGKAKVVLKGTKQKIERGAKRKRVELESGQQDNGDDSSVRSAALPMPPPSSDAE
mmetsp:Transcript_5345/g.7103  ORF Transcript_5345/g.7103 Transcript_5345/m.7103 type:complete len:360 (+) Transcript_5345:109-1188(+)|eukprot:CAMPEP_0185269538 /NCGR_PEP_ID=MMETSP1359-20130426/40139_1 /TAXON_ID=552665 /ORGANISM="Bigelowiella longifila, Strain CCMP242" /LENGTH=359 /DNA_ID=CAMNT_0027860753 /DNA_START=58 /DNA_END=1137 /DNA_ORIENTATION=+